MAAKKYLSNSGGKIVEVSATTTSSGAPDDGKIVALDSSGKLDISLFPTGLGADVTVVTASEALSAGNFVNYHNSTGIKVRKADASSNAKAANGFVLAAVSNGASATVYPISSKNDQLSGMTVGAEQWLSTTPGGVTETAPSGSGQIVQLLGRATSASAVVFSNYMYYELV